MIRPTPGRVIVGVADSPAGLRALRVAATQARLLDTEIIAVRVFALPPLDEESISVFDTAHALGRVPTYRLSRAWYRRLADRERSAKRAIEHAFTETLGAVPARVSVRAVASDGFPGRILVDTAHREKDLLVLGTRTRRRLPPLHRSISRYCAAHAACPVLIVPPHELARHAETTQASRCWRDLERHLAHTARES